MSDISAVQDAVRRQLMYAAQADLLEQMAGAVWDITSKTAGTVAAFAQGVRNGLPALESEVEKVHRQVAADANAAISSAYESSLKGTPPYRTSALQPRNRRYAGGILRDILESDFVTYDAQGIYIGNRERLDAGARQWQRLNYGAGGAAGGGAHVYAIKWSNINLFLEEPGGARPAFRIPGGQWFGQEFYPTSELKAMDRVTQRTGRRFGLEGGGRIQEPRMTRGIRGTHWLAAGLQVVAESIPAGYTQAFKKLWKLGDEEMQKQLRGTTGLTRPGSPRGSVS
jgi:hypothetical protein